MTWCVFKLALGFTELDYALLLVTLGLASTDTSCVPFRIATCGRTESIFSDHENATTIIQPFPWVFDLKMTAFGVTERMHVGHLCPTSISQRLPAKSNSMTPEQSKDRDCSTSFVVMMLSATARLCGQRIETRSSNPALYTDILAPFWVPHDHSTHPRETNATPTAHRIKTARIMPYFAPRVLYYNGRPKLAITSRCGPPGYMVSPSENLSLILSFPLGCHSTPEFADIQGRETLPQSCRFYTTCSVLLHLSTYYHSSR